MELYIKTIGDPNFVPGRVDSQSEIAQLITQIETVLFTNRGEVLGNSAFGCSLEDLVYSLNYNNFRIKSLIEQQLDRYCPLASKYKVTAEVSFLKGTSRDIALVDITINNEYQLRVTVN